jgi:hydrogenase expression/formation protein HypC
MRIVAIDGIMARCEARGVARDVCMLLLDGEPLACGDQVLVHVGYAIQKISDAEAATIWDTFDEALARMESEDA